MESYIATIIFGIIFIVIGILNMKGNISSLHSYHRKRVKEEDRILFGRKVGVGTIIIGISLIIFGTLMYAAELLTNAMYEHIANIILIIGLIVGIGFNFYAMFKYNKGIF